MSVPFSIGFGFLWMCLGKVGGVVDLSADATDLVTDVMAIQMAAPTLGFVFVFVWKDKLTHDNFQLLENGGLYWHLVDVIWIFLFPLFYLIT